MLQRILIANRGEIAFRIQQACHEMDKQVVAAYTQADASLKHLDYADDTICIGKHSYLAMDDLIMAAKLKNCDGIHPGYGLLSENAEFSEKAKENGLVLIGPNAVQLKQLEDKAAVRQWMSGKGLQTIPGSLASLSDLDEAIECAHQIEFPLLLKASFGGGGRGIRLIENEAQLAPAFLEAQEEAIANFGRGDLYLEKYLSDARHIEIQILGDGNGKAVHLGSRDCSIQRRHQKIIEEAPAPGIASEQLAAIAQKAVNALASMNYKSAATLEFLYQGGEFYFLEINPRLQVEHPVTEMISAIDIVKAQLTIADTGRLPFRQEDLVLRGCSIECRINAEDSQFRPSPGRITRFEPPGGNGIRVDTHIYAGYEVPHHYDSLLAKLIVHASNRVEALAKMRRALAETRLEGIETNIPVLAAIVNSPEFIKGEYTIRLLPDTFLNLESE